MKLTVENRTQYLNNYHFQTLCLLYFPGEKFPPNEKYTEDCDGNGAYFLLEEKSGGEFYSEVRLSNGVKKSAAIFKSNECEALINAKKDDIAAYTAGMAFLEAGKAMFGFAPPWGYLTGLRPAKRARFYLENGFNDERVLKLFTGGYGVSEEKARLSIEIAHRESALLSVIDNNTCCLYVAIPFCPTRCEYCSFVSFSNNKLFKLIPDYLERLLCDLSSTARMIKQLGMKLGYIYIGGGTPAVLTNEQIDMLLTHIENEFDFTYLTEYTFEAGRADCITPEKLMTVKLHGVNRVSVNPQSTNNAVLERIGRHHTVEQFYQAAEAALSCGFEAVNADLIAGLPNDTDETFYKSLADVLELGFNNITLHTLSVKNSAPLRFDSQNPYDAFGQRVRENVSQARRILFENMYYPYYLYRQKNTVGNAENTGFSIKGKECVYNILMMEEHTTVFACGASSITKLVSNDKKKIERIAFPKYPFEYLNAENGIGEKRINEFCFNGGSE